MEIESVVQATWKLWIPQPKGTNEGIWKRQRTIVSKMENRCRCPLCYSPETCLPVGTELIRAKWTKAEQELVNNANFFVWTFGVSAKNGSRTLKAAFDLSKLFLAKLIVSFAFFACHTEVLLNHKFKIWRKFIFSRTQNASYICFIH